MGSETIGIREILKVLPHRYPFLLLDRIVSIEPGQRCRAVKNVTINEPFFQGHFPVQPVMPAVLVVEALAQLGAFLLLHSQPEHQGQLFYFTGIDKARFRRPVVPGDQLQLEVQILQRRPRACKMRGAATVDGERAAEAIILSSLVDLEP
ncbi:MAG TPA: 3-hydroxyacyl-ACP dehydratase FabZ [Acidobacteriota bacterium]